MMQSLLIGFAGPIATFAIMEGKSYSRKELAAVFAMILAMSQANAVFPLLTVGLKFNFTLVSSIFGGLIAASATYYLFTRSLEESDEHVDDEIKDESAKKLLPLLLEGGQKGMQIVAQSVPMLMLAIFAVNVFNALGLIGLAERILSPVTEAVNIPSIAVLPFLTKYMAGGTAMMGVSLDLLNAGKMTATELNRIAGWMINPLDLVGIGLYMSAGPKTASIARIAVPGALMGIAARGILHFLYF
jgi:spore maturation protein SpmB